MAMRLDLVETLFARLSVRYGAEFSRRYEGLDQAAVIADWAHELDGYSGKTVKAALDHLPADRAPNAGQFAELCRVHAVGEMAPALPAPELTEEERRERAEVGRTVSAAIQAPRFGRQGMSERDYAIYRLSERIAAGGATQYQRHALATMRRARGDASA